MSSQPHTPQLSEQEKKDLRSAQNRLARKDIRRLRRLRHATGMPDWRHYPAFRRAIMTLANKFVEIEVVGGEYIPGGIDLYYASYDRNTSTQISSYGFVIATTHRTVWDIVGVGQIKRGMTWLCKAPFAMLFYARLCHRMGAMPLLRKQDRSLTGITGWLFDRYTFHELGEYEARVLKALSLGIPVVIFPEGTRKADAIDPSGSKNGAAAFARKANVPLIPAAAVGGTGKNGRDPERFRHKKTGRLLPMGSTPSRLSRLRYRRVVVYVIGAPIEPCSLEQGSDTGTTTRWERRVAQLAEVGRERLRTMS